MKYFDTELTEFTEKCMEPAVLLPSSVPSVSSVAKELIFNILLICNLKFLRSYRSRGMPHFFRFSQSDFRVMPSSSASCCSLYCFWYRTMKALV